MTYPHPPAGWRMATGTWGTDAERETTLYLSGGASIRMKNTTTATKLIGPMSPVHPGIANNKMYEATAYVRASSVSGGAGDYVTLQLKSYDASFTAIYTHVIYQNVLTAADTWQTVSGVWQADSGGTERFIRPEILKGTNAINVYWDAISFRAMAPMFKGTSGTTAVTDHASTWTAIASFTVDGSGFGALTAQNEWTNSSGSLTPHHTKPGTITARVAFSDSIADGSFVGIRIKEAGTVIAQTSFKVGAAGFPHIIVTVNDLLLFSAAYTVEVIQNSGSGDRNAVAYVSCIQSGW